MVRHGATLVPYENSCSAAMPEWSKSCTSVRPLDGRIRRPYFRYHQGYNVKFIRKIAAFSLKVACQYWKIVTTKPTEEEKEDYRNFTP